MTVSASRPLRTSPPNPRAHSVMRSTVRRSGARTGTSRSSNNSPTATAASRLATISTTPKRNQGPVDSLDPPPQVRPQQRVRAQLRKTARQLIERPPPAPSARSHTCFTRPGRAATGAPPPPGGRRHLTGGAGDQRHLQESGGGGPAYLSKHLADATPPETRADDDRTGHPPRVRRAERHGADHASRPQLQADLADARPVGGEEVLGVSRRHRKDVL